MKMTTIVCISDTHAEHRRLGVPDGDILIHSGDFTNRGEYPEVEDFASWLDSLPHKHKIVVPGNHDITFQTDPHTTREIMKYSCELLIDQAVTINGLVFYGIPWTPDFYPEHWAFNHPSPGSHAESTYRKMVKAKPNVVISHGPPLGVGDKILRGNVGCPTLLKYLKVLKPKLTVCGHIHEGHGSYETEYGQVVNAAILDGRYRMTNYPIVIEL